VIGGITAIPRLRLGVQRMMLAQSVGSSVFDAAAEAIFPMVRN
jgi:hypothetical protein